MKLDSAVERICRLPLDFKEGNKSAIQLVNECGLSQDLGKLNVEAVAAVLAIHPALIGAWLGWSSDKRCSSGWYFVADDDGYVVGYYPQGERLTFKAAERACAEFVLREVGEILNRVAGPCWGV